METKTTTKAEELKMKNLEQLFETAGYETYGSGCGYRVDEKNIPDLQDCYMTETEEGQRNFFAGLDKEKKRVFLAIACKVLDLDTFTNLIKVTVIVPKATEHIEKIEREICHSYHQREVSLERREAALRDCKKPIYKKIRELTERLRRAFDIIEQYKRRTAELKESESQLIRLSNRLKGECEKGQQLAQLIKELAN